MTTQIGNDYIENQLIWRYATKRFDAARKISTRDWQTLELALRDAPSSFGLQPWRFITVADMNLRRQLKELSWNQPQVVDASHLIVLAARTSVDPAYVESFLKYTAEVRGQNPKELEGYGSMINNFVASMPSPVAVESWCTHQTYLALGMLLSTAAMLQIDACPLEGIDRAAYNNALGMADGEYSVKVAVALGYRAADDSLSLAPKVRFASEKIFERR